VSLNLPENTSHFRYKFKRVNDDQGNNQKRDEYTPWAKYRAGGMCMYSVPPALTFSNPALSPQTVFMGFVWSSKHRSLT